MPFIRRKNKLIFVKHKQVHKKSKKEPKEEYDGGNLISTYIHPMAQKPYENNLHYKSNNFPPVQMGQQPVKFGAGNLNISLPSGIKHTKDERIKFIV